MLRESATTRFDMIVTTWVKITAWGNDKMLYPTLQSTCVLVSLVSRVVSIGLLGYVKPFRFCKHNGVCHSLVLFVAFPVLFAILKVCRFFDNFFEESNSIFGKIAIFVFTMVSSIGLGVGATFATENLEGATTLWGLLTLLMSISSMKVYFMVEKDVMLADSVFTIVLGLFCLKYKPKWHVDFLVATYFVRGAALSVLKQRYMNMKKAAIRLLETSTRDKLAVLENKYAIARGNGQNPVDRAAFHEVGASLADLRRSINTNNEGGL